MRITAAVMDKADGLVSGRTIRLEEVELDAPQDDEVLVRLTSCGVCGTDRGVIQRMEPVPMPCVLGGEGVGVVEAAGADVTASKPGDRGMMMELQREGRFPVEKLIRFYDFADVNHAIGDSEAGRTVKPILRMPHG